MRQPLAFPARVMHSMLSPVRAIRGHERKAQASPDLHEQPRPGAPLIKERASDTPNDSPYGRPATTRALRHPRPCPHHALLRYGPGGWTIPLKKTKALPATPERVRGQGPAVRLAYRDLAGTSPP
ncbi:hypothetical protein GCM10022416_12030 [Actinomadura keratinilytica]|uniref:Uncharacterized protein n=1 Tax=Actinomadura keratinilytica TaxID=547461 RepID=A0ABP7YAM4_9ACTN